MASTKWPRHQMPGSTIGRRKFFSLEVGGEGGRSPDVGMDLWVQPHGSRRQLHGAFLAGRRPATAPRLLSLSRAARTSRSLDLERACASILRLQVPPTAGPLFRWAQSKFELALFGHAFLPSSPPSRTISISPSLVGW
ncbi:hypothetical protein TYRP_016849 [Tyrophagus putrescentiae]|nr:hypothetical protein TYRP_016849 [Tyrophagus putrescentiae]